eukprot:Rhum_TRINITY_DN11613_c0_g2::Rhum_TRINITY_DN11613_c0_g2_i2::g.46237::m.46237/K02987/RP-S4e, RPS4; small subunit ribosomal protein S4e
MGRGPAKHMKRLNAPQNWYVSKLGGLYAPKARCAAHKERESLPLLLILRNRLRYALTGKEAMMITKQRLVEVDNKVRTDPKYPVGFMDVLTIPKSKDAFRVLYDVKGRFVLQKVDSEAAKFKLLKVRSVGTAVNGVPVLTTHDGRTIRFPDPLIARGDTIKFDLIENKIVDFIKFKPGTTVMVTGGANTGRVGKAVDVERHPGSFDIIHVKDGNGNTFATRLLNAFVVGRADEIAIGLPKAKGIRLPLIQDREQRIQTVAKQRLGKKRN